MNRIGYPFMKSRIITHIPQNERLDIIDNIHTEEQRLEQNRGWI